MTKKNILFSALPILHHLHKLRQSSAAKRHQSNSQLILPIFSKTFRLQPRRMLRFQDPNWDLETRLRVLHLRRHRSHFSANSRDLNSQKQTFSVNRRPKNLRSMNLERPTFSARLNQMWWIESRPRRLCLVNPRRKKLRWSQIFLAAKVTILTIDHFCRLFVKLVPIKQSHHCSENQVIKWNVTPLFDHFGGREGIYSFFIEPSFAFGALLSLSLSPSLLSFLFPLGGCVQACRPKGLLEGLQ